MHTTSSVADIVFTQNYALMVVVTINKSIIHRTFIDNIFGLNVCSMDMLKEINTDLSTIQPNNVPIHGFDNISKSTFGIITLPIKVGLVILNTPIYVMSGPSIITFFWVDLGCMRCMLSLPPFTINSSLYITTLCIHFMWMMHQILV